MRLVILTLILSLFIGYAEAQESKPSFAEQFKGAVSELTGAVEDWRDSIRKEQAQAKQFAKYEEAERLGCVTPAGTIDEACVEAKIGQTQGDSKAWATISNAWHEGKDYTSQVAGKISDSVSASVNAKIEPQVQKMRDFRDQIHNTWLWIKWSITFVVVLITLYILEPYVSLINTLLGMMGLAKRQDANQDLLIGLAAEVKALREKLDRGHPLSEDQ